MTHWCSWLYTFAPAASDVLEEDVATVLGVEAAQFFREGNFVSALAAARAQMFTHTFDVMQASK